MEDEDIRFRVDFFEFQGTFERNRILQPAAEVEPVAGRDIAVGDLAGRLEVALQLVEQVLGFSQRRLELELETDACEPS